MAEAEPAADAMTPYQLPFPKEAAKEIVVESAIPKDERLWVPQAENVLNESAARAQIRRAKPAPASQAVHGMVQGPLALSGQDWEAAEGSYVFEPPGETHTLYVPEDVEETITCFQVNGVMFYCDPYRITPATKTFSPRSTCAASTFLR